MTSVLVAGGSRDPNLITILEALRMRNVQILPLLVEAGNNPSLSWELDTGVITLNGNPLNCSGVFIRRDVFHDGGSDGDYRASAWFTVIQGWLAISPQVRVLNRPYIGRHTNKLHVLRLAQSAGLPIPATTITNDISRIKFRSGVTDFVAKPVTGGGYCQSLDTLLSETQLQEGIAATPAIVQCKLAGPDVRIYAIDNTFLGFRIYADKIDYRESRNRNIEPMDQLPVKIMQGLKRLMTTMGLNWCAADFKLDPKNGQLIFLEINSNPMFSVFDKVAQGQITDAIVGFLTNKS